MSPSLIGALGVVVLFALLLLRVPVWIALPHPAWVAFQARTGHVITDPMAVQIAGHYLKQAIESGLDSAREMYTLTVPETLDHLDAVLREKAA